MVQYTDDRGFNWSNQARGEGPANGFDKEMIVTVDEMQTSPYANNFYCAWSDLADGNKNKDKQVDRQDFHIQHPYHADPASRCRG